MAELKDLSPDEREEMVKRFRSTPPKNPDMLHRWFRMFAGINYPRTSVCDDHDAPFDAICASYFAEVPGAIIKASRGLGGKTFGVAGLVYAEGCTLGASVTCLGGSLEQSRNMQSYLNNTHPRSSGQFWQAPRAPRHLISGRPTMSEIKLSNGGQIKALPASQKSVRGPHPHRVRTDEIDEMEQEIFDAATGQAMGSDGIRDHFLASSTHQHPEGTFDYAWDLADELGWLKFEWCYKENHVNNGGWLSEEQIIRKRASVPADRWRIEFELQSPASEDLIFTEDVIAQLFDDRYYPKEVRGEYQGAIGEDIILLPPKFPFDEPLPRISPKHYETDNFTHGTDWGKTRHTTVLATGQKRTRGPDLLAAIGRFGRGESWGKMVDRHNKRVKHYGGVSYHDVTGVGSVLDELLMVPSEGWDFHWHKETLDAKNTWVRACETGEIIYPNVKSLKKACRKLTREMLYYDKHTPDEVIALMLERQARYNLAWDVLIGR